MRRVLGCALLLAVLGGLARLPAPQAGAAEIVWLDDLAAARAAAEKSGKPLFLVFRCEP